MVSAFTVVFVLALDNYVYRCMDNKCVKQEGEAEMKFITVDGSGKLWALDSSSHVNYWDNQWKSFSESTQADYLAVKRDGTPYIIGKGMKLYKWNRSRWDVMPDGKQGTAIVFDGADNMWIIDENRYVWYTYADKWFDMHSNREKATDIAASRDGDAYIIGDKSKVYNATMNRWEELPNSSALDIAVDSAGTLWAIGLDKRIWHLDEKGVWQHYGDTIKGSKIAVF